jgi:hypothetical protein
MNGTQAATFAFVNKLGDFSYEMSSSDRVWNILFPDNGNTWNHLHASKDKSTFYITHINGDGGTLQVEPKKSVKIADLFGTAFYSIERNDRLAAVWESLITSALRWLDVVRKDWIKANRQIQAEYPLQYRYGTVPNILIQASLPDVYRLDVELGKVRTREMVRLVEEGFFFRTENTETGSLTADDYFRYCKIAYAAGKRKGEKIDTSLSGREMYSRYADGRHEGLLDIDPTSKKEFADWIDRRHPKREGGGHPWEIKRGGNTTHIDLSVFRPSSYRQESFKVELRGESIGRMAETVRMFLAIHKAKLPISLAKPEGIRNRLLAQDNIGIAPSYAMLHRANQRFDKSKWVFDVIHYNDLGRFKRRITPFIAWEPLPILTPHSARS